MVSIATQKKIMWIPFVNVVNVLIFSLNCRNVKIGSHAWWMSFVYFFGYGMPCFMLSVLLNHMVPTDSPIIAVCSGYLFPVVISHGLIKYQEKYLNC